MILSLKKVGECLRLLVKRLNRGTAFVSDCCCIADVLTVWQECCDGNPRIAIPFSTLNRLGQNGATLLYGPNCYRVIQFVTVTRDEAQQAGYTIVEDETRLTVVQDGPGGTPCMQPPCRICPQECCLTALYPSGCNTELSPFPENNLCCNYGMVAQRTYSDIERSTLTYYTSVNASQGDTYCPPGCSFNLFKYTSEQVSTYSEVARFQKCNDFGDQDERIVSCEADFVSTNNTQTRRYGFEGGSELACLGFTDTFTGPDGTRSQDCRFPSSIDGFYFPPPLQINGENVCELFDRVEVADPDNNNPPGQWTYTTNLARERGCFTGQYSLLVEGIKRAVAGSECPPPGTIIARSRYSRVVGYSITTVEQGFCEGNQFCSDYRNGRRGIVQPQPDQGALSLL